MPLPRFQRLPEDKRSQLLEIAAKEFADKGFEAASLNEILAAAGFGKSSYYYYFEDKEDLYSACLLDAFERLAKEVPPLVVEPLTARTLWPTVERYFQALIEITSRHPVQMTLFRELPRHRRQLESKFREAAMKATAPVVQLIEKGQAVGVVRTDLDSHTLFSLGMAADNVLDETFLSREGAFTPAALQAHGRVVLDAWRRLLAPARATKQRRSR